MHTAQVGPRKTTFRLSMSVTRFPATIAVRFGSQEICIGDKACKFSTSVINYFLYITMLEV